MTPAQRIRKAALGPTPKRELLWGPVVASCPLDVRLDFIRHYLASNEIERRMFLLFVAEALENE